MLKTFMPSLLPIQIDAQEHIKLLRHTIRVSRTLERLCQNVKISPVRSDLLSVFSLIEAVKSNSIEGTQTTFDEMMEAEVTKKFSNEKIEVSNYDRALNYGRKQIIENKVEIDNKMLCEIHKIILEGSRGEKKNPGKFRNKQNWIKDSQNIMYIPPEAKYIDELMNNLIDFINYNDYEPLMAIGIIHAQFETIHPFADGNGRVGRILIPLYLLKHNVCGNFDIFISDELEKNKYKYYTLLNNIRKDRPEWYEWLDFFLSSIENQALRYIEKTDKIVEIYSKYINDKNIENSAIAQKILITSMQNIIFNSSLIAEATDVSLATVNKWLKYFVDIKMLYTDSKQRHKVYRFYELLDAIR
ncbi:Fic family protein [Candidatus Falkowbacteria bacterium]|nr:Fic family protein [Candidatus Falkowbacteria bacterium]